MADKQDRSVRPEYVPERIKWWYGEPLKKDSLESKLREANVADIMPLSTMWRTKPYLVHRWITQHNYSVWCVVRNRRTIVAAIVARHGPSETTVLRFFCAPSQNRTAVLAAFLQLVHAEMPEWRVTWTVAPRDGEWVCDALRALGWKVERSDDDTGCNDFVYPAIITRTNPSDGKEDRA